MESKKAALRLQSRLPGLGIRFIGSIFGTATMTCNFPTYRRHGSLQKMGDLTNR